MSVDVTSLSISISSHGVQDAANALKALSEAATLVEGKTKTIKEATSGLSSSQQASVANIEKLIAGFQKQADLVGANVSQINAYTTAMKGGTKLEQEMAMMLGAEVDAYRAKALAQTKAVADNKALEASYKKLQQEADAFYASQAKAQSAGNALNAAGVQANEYKKLAMAQAEAIKMNNLMDASNKRLETDHGKAIIEDKARAYAVLAATQAEAIKMNNALDASVRRLAMDEAARKQSLFNNALQQGHDLARGLSGSLGALWLTYGNIGMMIAGVAIGAALKEAVTGFAKVEYQMTFVKALAEDTTHSVGELTARMHDVAGALGIAPEAAAKGLRALTQAGLNTSDALATLPVAFKLAAVGELALESAALAATGVMNAYDLKVSNLEHIGDVMAKAGAMSAASVDSISVSMKYSAGTAEQYGVSLEKLGSILTLLGKRGITGSSAGVAANNLIAELYSPSSEKAIKAAAALGVKAYVDGVRQPIEDVVKSFKDGLGKFDSESQGMLLEAYFGKKGGKAFYALAQGTKEEFKAMETQLVNSTGFVADVYKANLKTVEGQLNLTKSAITNMFAKVGEESAEPIRELLVSIRTMASSQGAQDMFIGLTQSIKTLVTTVIPAAAAFGALFLSFKIGAAVTVAWAAAIGFAETAMTVGLIPAVKALNIAMLSNPIGMVVGLITVLAGAYLLLKRNKESVHDLHKKDMEQSAETLKAGNDEIEMLEKQLALRGQNIRGDAEAGAIKELQANEKVLAIQQKITDNTTQILITQGLKRSATTRGTGVDSALEKELSAASAADRENKQLEKDLVQAKGTYKQLSEQNKSINDLKKRLREEDKRMDAEDLANATPKVIGNQKYNGNEKGLKAAASDAYAAAIAKEHDLIKASKTAMQNFEDTQNNLYKAGEIGKLKFIQEVGNQQVVELEKQHKAIEAQIGIAAGKKNGKADTQKFGDDLVANELAAKTVKIKTAEETNVQLAQYAQENTKFQIQELETQGKFGAAAALKFSSENKLAFKQAEQDIADFGDKFPIITERYKQLQAARDAAIGAGNEKEALKDFMDLSNATRNALKGIQTANEGQGLAEMFNAASAASATLAGNMDELRARMGKLTEPKDINEAQAQLTNLAETQRKLWVGVGDSISKSLKDAFGKSGQAAGDLIKVAQNYSMLGNKTDSARIKAYGDAAGAAKGFFKEGTKGYEIMAGAEKAFRAVELIGMARSLATTITNAAATAAAWSPAVVMAYMAQMGPPGWAAAAAAIAALGVAFSGGGADTTAVDRQKTQGTGSVLGSTEQSSSISNSLSILEKNSGLGLAHNNTMIHYLKNVSDNISTLAVAVVQKTGISGTKVAGVTEGLTSIFSSIPLIGGVLSKLFGTSTTVLDQGFTANKTTLGQAQQNGINASQYADVNTKKSFFGFSYSNSTNRSMSSMGDDVNKQIKLVIDGMASTITEAAKTLGMGGDAFTEHLKTFVIDIGNISVKGLSGAEIEKAFSAVFSKLGDDMTAFALGGLTQFQKVNEGLLETVSRLANDLIQVKDVFNVLGKTFNLTGISAITVSENLIAAAGSLDKLTTGTKFFVDNFLSEAEKMEPITKSVTDRMADLHYSNVTTIEDFSKLVRSLDLTDPAAQTLYASLIDIAPAFKGAADYALKLAEGTVTLTKAQQKALDAVNKAKTNLQDAYNKERDSLQGVIDKTTAFITTLKSYQDSLKLGADSPLTNMQKYAEARRQFDATAAAANGGDQAAKDKFVSASSALLAASKVINASGDAYTNDFNMVQNAIDALMGSSTTQIDVATASLNALNDNVAGLIDINKSVISVQQAVKELQAAIMAGGVGGLSGKQMDVSNQSAIESLYTSMLGRSSDAQGSAFWQKALADGVSLSHIQGEFQDSAEYKALNGSHKNGLARVPFDGYRAELHKDERVLTAPEAMNYNRGNTSDPALIKAIEALQKEVATLRGEQKEQVGAQIKAAYDSTDKAADSTISGLATATPPRKIALA